MLKCIVQVYPSNNMQSFAYDLSNPAFVPSLHNVSITNNLFGKWMDL